MNTVLKILFVLVCTSPAWVSAIFFFCMWAKDKLVEIRSDKNGSLQHRTFSQLKKGDFIWEVYGTKLNIYVVKNVEYHFRYDNTLDRIYISFKNHPHIIKMDAKNAKEFRYLDYFTLYGEATTTRKHNEIQRQKELDKIQTLTAEELEKSADRVVKHLENLKKNYLENK